jgi:hypothetical protein
MSNKQQISALKELFHKGKVAPKREDGRLADRKLYNAVGEALIDVGKEKLYELADEIYPYLNDPFSEFRAEAVRTLGWNTRLGIDEFCRDQAYQIWEKDDDEEVKLAALTSWGRYYSETKDSHVLQTVYNILISKQYSSEIRALAFRLLLDISDTLDRPKEAYSVYKLGEIEEREEFDRAIDWDRVHRVMTECVPDWKRT